MSKLLCLFLLSIQLSFAQTKAISGIVSDTLFTPLEKANVLSKALTEKLEIKFAIAGNKICFKIKHQ